MNHLLLTLSLIITAQSHATALDQIKLPQGFKRPTANATPASQMASRAANKKDLGKQILPPARLIYKDKVAASSKVTQIIPSRHLSDTPHMAAALKQAGYRLYKKRSRMDEGSWTYWLKTPTGEPSYKVEVHWIDAKKTRANLNIWSWDDKTQFEVTNMKNLIGVFSQ